jgi:hypothetical protein
MFRKPKVNGFPSEDRAHLESSIKVPMPVRPGVCVNHAKRLKLDMENSDSVSEKMKAEAAKRRGDDALSLKNVDYLTNGPACWFANSVRPSGSGKEV